VPIEMSFVCFENPGHTERAFLTAAAKAVCVFRRCLGSRRKPIFSSGCKLAAILRASRADILPPTTRTPTSPAWWRPGWTGVKTVSSLYVLVGFRWKRNLLQWIINGPCVPSMASPPSANAHCATPGRTASTHPKCGYFLRVLTQTESFLLRPSAPRAAGIGRGLEDIVLDQCGPALSRKSARQIAHPVQTTLDRQPRDQALASWRWTPRAGTSRRRGVAQPRRPGSLFGFRPDLERVLKLADITSPPVLCGRNSDGGVERHGGGASDGCVRRGRHSRGAAP